MLLIHCVVFKYLMTKPHVLLLFFCITDWYSCCMCFGEVLPLTPSPCVLMVCHIIIQLLLLVTHHPIYPSGLIAGSLHGWC
jgi:hypothetical protein